MATRKRIRKHDLKEDQFVTATFQFTTYVREHQNTFLALAAGIVVVAILMAVMTSSRSRAQDSASRLLGEAEIFYSQGALNQVTERCGQILDQYGGTPQADKAAFYLADSHLKMQQYQQAIDAFQLYIDKYHGDPTLSASSYMGIAAGYEQLEQFSQAGDYYLMVSHKYPDYYGAPESLLSAGRCFRLSGDLEKAKQAYSVLIEKYSDSREIDVAKMEMAEAQALIELKE